MMHLAGSIDRSGRPRLLLVSALISATFPQYFPLGFLTPISQLIQLRSIITRARPPLRPRDHQFCYVALAIFMAIIKLRQHHALR